MKTFARGLFALYITVGGYVIAGCGIWWLVTSSNALWMGALVGLVTIAASFVALLLTWFIGLALDEFGDHQ